MAEIDPVRVTLHRKSDYRFEVDWGLPGLAPGQLDEPEPLGK